MVARSHIRAAQWPAVVYGIGDVHGCYDELQDLVSKLTQDAQSFRGEKWLVMLGDYVDRGPNSAATLAWLETNSTTFQRFALVGNHETMMLGFCDAPRADHPWLGYGGLRTLESYGLLADDIAGQKPATLKRKIDAYIPSEHLALMRAMPLSVSIPGLTMVHANARLDFALAAQKEADLLWSTPTDPAPGQGVLVHGHTPAEEVVDHPTRIGLDTGAYLTGRLSAVRLTPDGGRRFFDNRT